MSQPEHPPIAVGQLRHAWLAGVAFKENDRFDIEAADRITYGVDYTHRVQPVVPADVATDEADDQEGAAILFLDATVDWFHVDGEEFEPPFELSLKVAGLFAWERTTDLELMEAWLEYNGVYLLWPYLRSFVATITGASSLPPLTLYTMRVPDPPRLSDDAAEEAPARKTESSRHAG